MRLITERYNQAYKAAFKGYTESEEDGAARKVMEVLGLENLANETVQLAINNVIIRAQEIKKYQTRR